VRVCAVSVRAVFECVCFIVWCMFLCVWCESSVYICLVCLACVWCVRGLCVSCVCVCVCVWCVACMSAVCVCVHVRVRGFCMGVSVVSGLRVCGVFVDYVFRVCVCGYVCECVVYNVCVCVCVDFVWLVCLNVFLWCLSCVSVGVFMVLGVWCLVCACMCGYV